jgi:hypothetical protein
MQELKKPEANSNRNRRLKAYKESSQPHFNMPLAFPYSILTMMKVEICMRLGRWRNKLIHVETSRGRTTWERAEGTVLCRLNAAADRQIFRTCQTDCSGLAS